MVFSNGANGTSVYVASSIATDKPKPFDISIRHNVIFCYETVNKNGIFKIEEPDTIVSGFLFISF